jgi:hypothetical protein
MLRRSFCAEREYHDFEVSWKLHKAAEVRFDGGPRGRWRDLEHGGKQYRTDKGAIVNWWKASGKILFQGQGSVVSKFEQAFTAIASTKGRLENEDGKSLRDLERENETLRTLIADVLLENARLRRVS